MYFLKKRPLKKPRLKIPNTHYKFNKIYYTRLNRLPDEILRNIYQFIFPIRDIKQVKSLWCNSCGAAGFHDASERHVSCSLHRRATRDQRSAARQSP